MNIHEYQAKELLAGFGIIIPRGGLAYSPEQAAYRAREIGGQQWVVKAQVHCGGRGKAGGVIVCHSENEVYDAADNLFGHRLTTKQTGAGGKIVYRVYVEGFVKYTRGIYLGFVLDRRAERIMVVASAAGGMDIEEIAAQHPDSIIRSVVEPAVGMQAFQAREISFKLKIDPALINETVETILGCYRAFEQLDATMVEINPLAVSEDNHIFALDARMTIDDNALFRRPDIAELRDKSQEDPRETRAADRGLNYMPFEGNIGCIVNGSGLAMATMDMITQAGGHPANFLDIGGGANPDRMAKAIRLVRADDNVEALLINIFAGINRCDWIAEGIVDALKKDPIDIPLVVRLTGTSADLGSRALAKSGLPIVRAASLAEAATRTVQAVNYQQQPKTKSGSKAGSS